MLVCRAIVVIACSASSASYAADIGGWMTQQERAQQSSDGVSCAQLAARASRDASPQTTYQTALCYLQGDEADPVAAKAWLTKAAELNHLPAHRMLSAMQAAQAGRHPASAHCHDLGEGRQLCHGGAAP
jgi:TPR repeat protein